MTTPTHCVAGFLISKWFIAAGLIPPEYKGLAITVGIISANGPDFDVLIFGKFLEHRKSPLHTPLNWIMPLTSLLLLASLFRQYIFTLFILLFLTGVLLHFVMDSIGSGIRWLAPFNQREYGLKIVDSPASDIKTFIRNNFRYPLVLLDIAIWLICLTWGRPLFHV